MFPKQISPLKAARAVMLALLVLAIPIFLVTLSLRTAFNSSHLYNYGFTHYRVDMTTGIDLAQVKAAGRDIIRYFNDDRVYLDTRVTVGGQTQPLFNEREVLHMKDVKTLVRRLVYDGFWASASFVIAFIFLAPLAWRQQFVAQAMKGLLWGSALTVTLLLTLGVALLVGFDSVFTQFHVLSFSNDFWQLDPARDHLIQMYPEEFFRDASLMIAGACITASLLMGAMAMLYLHGLRRSGQT